MNENVKSTARVYHVGTTVQVGRRVRSGGRYAAVSTINRDGSIRPSPSPLPLIVRFPESDIRLVTPGTVWLVDGPEVITSYVHAGDRRYERTIEATTATFVKPTGRNLVRWLQQNVTGIGDVLSNRLVRNKNLVKWVEAGSRESLLAIQGMSDATVDALLLSWPSVELFKVISFLDEYAIPPGISKSIINVLNEDALPILQSNPFILLGLGVPFKTVAEFATRIGFNINDPQCVGGVAAHAAFVHSEETGATVIDAVTLRCIAERLAQCSMPENLGDVAVSLGLMVKCGESAYQGYGCALMEHEVADFLLKALLRTPGYGAGLGPRWETQIDRKSVEDALQRYQAHFLDFQLLPEQREAVIGSVLAPVCGISGGAGTGKTTILRAVLGCFQELAPELTSYQVAVAGRVAQRMAESTGKPAQTIAKLIADHMGEGKPELPDHLLLVIDEASMLDLLSMYRLVRFLPHATRIIFVGDSMQILPVGKGLVLHALQDSGVPFFELKQVMRQDEQSGIHRFATDLRNGIVAFPPSAATHLEDCADCSLIESSDPNRLAEMWREAGGIGAGMVLCPVKSGTLGVDNINVILQRTVGLERPQLFYRDCERGRLPWITPDGSSLLLGDPVLVTQNNYGVGADVRNGNWGILEYIIDPLTNSESFGQLRMSDGKLIDLNLDLLGKLSLGYAMTMHKSQGSQWPTCFITLPKNATSMVDQSLLYTAVTRAEKRALLFGDPRLIEIGIARGPASLERVTTLAKRIQYMKSLLGTSEAD